MLSHISMLVIMSTLVTACSTSKGARAPSSEVEERFDLNNIYSMQRSFWSDQREGKEYFGRFSAFVVKDDMSLEGFARLLVYVEDPKTSVMNKVVDNRQFVWSGIMAGTEPNLEVNRKNSLVIASGNDGVGRMAWHERVTARFLASTGKVEVVGYDYDSYDKLQLDDGYTCSYNFLTGEAKATVIKKTGVIRRKVKGIRGPFELNAWTEANRPKDCIP